MSDQKKSFDLGELAHNVFLAGVGAASIVGEKASGVADTLVAKGKDVVEQGKAVNEELSRKAADAMSETTANVLKTQLKTMTPEQREEFVAKIRAMADEANAKEHAEAAETVDEVERAAAEVDAEEAVEPDSVEDADA